MLFTTQTFTYGGMGCSECGKKNCHLYYYHEKKPACPVVSPSFRPNYCPPTFAQRFKRSPPCGYEQNWLMNFTDDVVRDFEVYFRRDNLLLFGSFVIAAGICANTHIDRTIQERWQEDFRPRLHDGFFKTFKYAGDIGWYYFPIYLTAMAAGYWGDHCGFGNVVYHWGYRSIRTYILGGVQQVILTHALSGGRPKKGQDSKWQPFKYKTGVSGHAHYGAIPFLTAAMMTDPPILKFALYAMSTLPGLSRINNDCHYFSQVLLGWSIAFLSARAVYQSDLERCPRYLVNLVPYKDGFKVAASMRF